MVRKDARVSLDDLPLSLRGGLLARVKEGRCAYLYSFLAPRIDRIRQAEVGRRRGPMSLVNNGTKAMRP